MSVDLSIKIKELVNQKDLEGKVADFYPRMELNYNTVLFDGENKCDVSFLDKEIYISSNAVFYDFVEFTALVIAKILNISKIYDPQGGGDIEVTDVALESARKKIDAKLGEVKVKEKFERSEWYEISDKYAGPGKLNLNEDFEVAVKKLSEEMEPKDITLEREVGIGINVYYKGTNFFRVTTSSSMERGNSILVMACLKIPKNNLEVYNEVMNKLRETFGK